MLFSLLGCEYKTDRSQSAPARSASPSSTAAPEAIVFDDKALQEAWRLFAKDGRYRMAQPKDFTFSEAAQIEMGPRRFKEYTTRPVAHWWGGIGVIVVDTTRPDQNRFGVIVFMEPDNYSDKETKACPHKPVWLYKNKDLSRTVLEGASGYWFVNQYDDSGKRTSKDEKEFGWKHRNHCG